jgi:hypothetical protein
MTKTNEEVARFSDALEKTPNLWRSIEIRAIAVERAGAWYNLRTAVALSGEESSRNPQTLGQVPHLIAVRDNRPIADLPGLLASLSSES